MVYLIGIHVALVNHDDPAGHQGLRFSPAAGLKSGQFNQKRNFALG
jgi:hypothetical protein